MSDDAEENAARRRHRASGRLRAAMADPEHPAIRLSDVMYDAAADGVEVPDGEGGWDTPRHGYDLDDLAAVLVPLLAASVAAQALLAVRPNPDAAFLDWDAAKSDYRVRENAAREALRESLGRLEETRGTT